MNATVRRVLWVIAVLGMALGWSQKAWTQDQQRSRGAAASAASAPDLDESALTALDRQILEFVNESQLDELLNGTDPADIYLSNGETLGDLTARTQQESSRNLVFAPLRACRLFDTRLTEEGPLRRGETRGFSVRTTDGGYASQGGSEEGCDLPGLSGLTLRTNSVRAVALNILTLEVGGPGSLAIWPGNRSEPEIGSVSFAAALAGGGVTGGVLVAVCDEAGLDPCSSGDLKIRAKISGAHVVADVVGYFHAASSAGATLISETTKQRNGAHDEPADSARTNRAPISPGPSSPVATYPGRELDGVRALDLARRSPGEPVVEPPLGGFPPDPRGPFVESAIVAKLVTGHGPGGAVDVYIENDQALFDAAAVKAFATTGNGVWSTTRGGRAVYGITEYGFGVYGFDGGSEPNRGYGGYFYSTNGIGAYGYSGANRTHPNILAPGLYGQSNQGVGVYGRGDTSNSFSFFNEGGFFEGGKGLYALGTDSSGEIGYGARVFSNQYRGMYVQGSGTFFDAYFGGSGGISTNGIVNRAGPQALVVNLGFVPIEPGDLVAMVGVSPSPETGQPMLAVAKLDSSNSHAVIGVAARAFAHETRTDERGTDYIDFSPIPGASLPNGYVAIVTEGLAPAVRMPGVAQSGGWRIGDRIGLSDSGVMELTDDSSGGVTIGKVASPVDPASGTVALFVHID